VPRLLLSHGISRFLGPIVSNPKTSRLWILHRISRIPEFWTLEEAESFRSGFCLGFQGSNMSQIATSVPTYDFWQPRLKPLMKKISNIEMPSFSTLGTIRTFYKRVIHRSPNSSMGRNPCPGPRIDFQQLSSVPLMKKISAIESPIFYTSGTTITFQKRVLHRVASLKYDQ
jgi:hypothetical protein